MWTVPFLALLKGALRDKMSLFWALAFPAGLLLGLGQAFPEAPYRASLLGGVVFLSAAFFSASGTAFTVLAQRNRGIYKLLRVTPASTLGFVLTLTAARFVVGLGCAVLVALFGALVLDVDVPLSALGLSLLVLAPVLVAFALLGFALGNLANNESQTAGLNNLVTLPVMFLTSALYSLDRLPEWLSTIARHLPFEHVLIAMRHALAGESGALLGELPILVAFVAATLALAVLTFRWDPAAPVALRLRRG